MPALGSSPFGLHPVSGVQLRTVARRLRDMDDRKAGALFRRELRAAAAPLVPAVRASIGKIPSKSGGPRRGQLRRDMQRATKLYVRTSGPLTGVVIMVDGRKMPAGEKSLPAYEEGTKPHWRHPVFGKWLPGQADQPPHPYFYSTVRPLGVFSRAAVGRAMSRTESYIAGRRTAIL